MLNPRMPSAGLKNWSQKEKGGPGPPRRVCCDRFRCSYYRRQLLWYRVLIYNFANEGDQVLSARTTVIVKRLHPSSSLNLDLANLTLLTRNHIFIHRISMGNTLIPFSLGIFHFSRASGTVYTALDIATGQEVCATIRYFPLCLPSFLLDGMCV